MEHAAHIPHYGSTVGGTRYGTVLRMQDCEVRYGNSEMMRQLTIDVAVIDLGYFLHA
jgi:hypothetical protein